MQYYTWYCVHITRNNNYYIIFNAACYVYIHVHVCTHVCMYIILCMTPYVCPYIQLLLCLLGIAMHNCPCMSVYVCFREKRNCWEVFASIKINGSLHDRHGHNNKGTTRWVGCTCILIIDMDGINELIAKPADKLNLFLVGEVMRSEQNNGGSSCLEARLHTVAYLATSPYQIRILKLLHGLLNLIE